MDASRSKGCRRGLNLVALTVLAACVAQGGAALGQNAQFNIDDPSRAGGSRSLVGPALGSANFADGAPVAVTPISGKAGSRGTHAPLGGVTNPTTPTRGDSPFAALRFQSPAPAAVPNYGNLALPDNLGLSLGQGAFGPDDGLTIDSAIQLLVNQSLEIQAARLEIPMAEADVLTAGLRANPVFYADQQLIPYGHYSFLRPGGPNQTDVNVNVPFDVNGKRKARVNSAKAARDVTEAQLQDAVRNQIDTLYTVYVDAIAARLTLQFSRVALTGVNKLVADYTVLGKQGEETQQKVDTFRAQQEQTLVQVREAVEAVAKAQLALATILNVEPGQGINLQVRDGFRDVAEIPESTDSLMTRAFKSRPDLQAIRIGVRRATADVALARKNAFPDIYATYQPYTYQNNQYLGVNSPTSYTLGVTANVPLFNRNQGNIKRARINVGQTELQVKAMERQVAQEVVNAVREFELSRKAVIDQEEKIVPTSLRIRNAAEQQLKQGEMSSPDFVEAQQDFNQVVASYRDALIRHRRAMLDLNTAVGERLY